LLVDAIYIELAEEVAQFHIEEKIKLIRYGSIELDVLSNRRLVFVLLAQSFCQFNECLPSLMLEYNGHHHHGV
jgi:hypothetical protein